MAELSLLQRGRPSLTTTLLTIPSCSGCVFAKYPCKEYLKIQSQLFPWQMNFLHLTCPGWESAWDSAFSNHSFLPPFWVGTADVKKKEIWGKQSGDSGRGIITDLVQCFVLDGVNGQRVLKKSEHSVFVEFCWYFLLFESAENSLILLLLFPLRLYSKVTGQNAVPNYCRSPLPISTDHSMLPDITGVKLCSIRPICSEYILSQTHWFSFGLCL